MERESRNFEIGTESLLLYGGLFLLSLQLFGDYTPAMHAAVRVLFYLLAAALVTGTGMEACEIVLSGRSGRAYLRLAAGYYGLFLVTGLCRECLDNGHRLVNSLFGMLLFRTVPKYSEIWFTLALLAAASYFLAPWMVRGLRHRRLMAFLSVAALAVIWFPSHLIEYPFVGAWLGADTYRSIPLLAFLGFYFLGFLMDGGRREERKPAAWVLPAGLLFSLAILFWKRSALVSKLHFPSSYWEVLFPVGLVLLFFFLCGKILPALRGRALSLLTADAWGRTALGTLLLWLIAALGYRDLRAYLRPLLFLAAWAAAALLIFLIRHALRWIGEGLGQSGRVRPLPFTLTYTLGFALLFGLLFLPFWENGISLVWDPDAVAQYFPKAVYFSQTVRDTLASFLQGDFTWKTYDFAIGMGNRVQLSLDPVYWLYALFSPEQMETGFNFVTIVRFWLTGLSASALFLYLKKEVWLTLLCSYAYAFSGYALYAVGRHPQFGIGMAFLPLLVVAVERILREKKWGLGAVLVALSLLSSYYFLYMNTIALVVLFLVRFFCMDRAERTPSRFLNYLGIFSGTYLLGLGMGCLTFVGTISSYASSGRVGSGRLATDSILNYLSKWPGMVYSFFITTGDCAGFWLKAGAIPLVYLCVVFLFLRKGHRELKILLGLCLAAVLIPFAGYAMGGFANVSNRWAYIFLLLLSVVLAETIPLIRSLTKDELKILAVSVLPYFAIVMMYGEYSDAYTAMALSLLLASLVILIFSSGAVDLLSGRQMQVALGLLVCLSLYVGGDTFFGKNGEAVINEYVESGSAYESASSAAISALTDLDDDSFYRVTESHPSASQVSASLLLGVNSISYFSSSMNGSMLDFDAQMGNVTTSLVKQKNYNNRTMLNELACVKYYSVSDELASVAMIPYGYTWMGRGERGEMGYDLYENEYALPLGYTYTQVMDADDFAQYSSAQKQEILMSTAVVEEKENLTQSYTRTAPALTGQEIPIDSVRCSHAQIGDGVIEAEEEGSVTFRFAGLPNAETYLVLRGTCESEDPSLDAIDVRVKDESGKYVFVMRSPEENYYIDMDEYVINCGYSEEGLGSVKISFKNAGSFFYDAISVYCQPMDAYPSQVEALCEDVLEDIEILDDGVRGTISLDQGKLLVLSIPWQNGWTAYVDGQETDLFKVNVMYTGLELAPGEHTVELTYRTPGMRLALVITAGSVMLFLVLLLCGRRRRRVRKE